MERADEPGARVLDLALLLPAVAASGVLLLRHHRLGYATAPAVLVFLALNCLPILTTPLVAAARGHDPGWVVLLPVCAMLAVILTALWHTRGRLT